MSIYKFVRVSVTFSPRTFKHYLQFKDPPIVKPAEKLSLNFYSGKMSASAEDYKVEHDKKNKHFFVELGEKEESNARAILEYDIHSSKGDILMEMYHTEVPPAMQGKGIAQLLAKAAMDHAVVKGYKMRLTCSYLKHYIKKNPNEEYVKMME